jgi:hypothetical protein
MLSIPVVAPRAQAEPPTIYKWIDENGIAHYTTDRGRIPKEVRTRVERAPDVAAPPREPHRQDVLRDAIPATPPAAAPRATAAPAPKPAEAEVFDGVVDFEDVKAAQPAESVDEVEAVEEVETEPVAAIEAIPAPLATDAIEAEPMDPVSAPPPAPVAPLAPEQTEEVAKLDGQIASLEGQIAEREEKLATLIATSDDQRTTPLVDDPAFRDISQRLPKLQAELQTLRERRNKIQPPATP